MGWVDFCWPFLLGWCACTLLFLFVYWYCRNKGPW